MAAIHNWREAWKMLSVQANTIGVAITGQYVLMYDHMKEIFPPKMMIAVVTGVFLLGIIARLTKQTSLEKPDGTPQP